MSASDQSARRNGQRRVAPAITAHVRFRPLAHISRSGRRSSRLPLKPGRAAVRLKPMHRPVPAQNGPPILNPVRKTDAWSARETMVQRIALACAALVILASPLRAQQIPRQQPVPAQPVPDQNVPPPPQPAPELPPPFIPPPPARAYDDYRPRAHHHARAHRHATARPHARAHRHQVARRSAAHGRHPATHVSMRASRRCQAMTYRQIIRHGICRALMRRDLQAAEHRRARASHHHRASRHHRVSRHHRSRR